MKCEHWIHCPIEEAKTGVDWNGDSTLLQADAEIKITEEMTKGLKYCCTIKGKNWNDCMQKYYNHMNWGRYNPF